MKIAVIIIAIVVLGGAGYFVYSKYGPTSKPTNSQINTRVTTNQTSATNTNFAPTNNTAGASINVNLTNTANSATSGLATSINFSIQTSRLLALAYFLESYHDEFDKYPDTMATIQSSITACRNKTLDLPKTFCDNIQESTYNFRSLMEDVYTGQTFALRFYGGLTEADKKGLTDGTNTFSEKNSDAIPTIDRTFQTDYSAQIGGAGCFLVNHPDIADRMPNNTYTQKWVATFLSAKTTSVSCATADTKTDWSSQLLTDIDNDGLVQLLEYAAGTSPAVPDTDLDGHSDLEELQNGYNPNGPGHLENQFSSSG
jgi:hypothetical protein